MKTKAIFLDVDGTLISLKHIKYHKQRLMP